MTSGGADASPTVSLLPKTYCLLPRLTDLASPLAHHPPPSNLALLAHQPPHHIQHPPPHIHDPGIRMRHQWSLSNDARVSNVLFFLVVNAQTDSP